VGPKRSVFTRAGSCPNLTSASAIRTQRHELARSDQDQHHVDADGHNQEEDAQEDATCSGSNQAQEKHQHAEHRKGY
jgi:hypothetical protein